MIDLTEKIIYFNGSNLWYYLKTLLVILSVVTVLRSKIGKQFLLASRLPGPNGLFLVGMLPVLLQGPGKFVKNLHTIYRTYEKSLFKLWVCNSLYVMLTQPEDIEFVLKNPKLQKKSKEYLVLQESIMGQGIFSINDIHKWKKNRKTISGGFSFTILKSFIPKFYYEAEVLSDVLQKGRDPNSGNCEISGPISMATMEIIGKTALDVSFNAQNAEGHPFVESLLMAMHTWEYRILHPWYLSKTLFRFSSAYKQHTQSHENIKNFTDAIIKKKCYELNRNDRNEGEPAAEDDDDVCRKPKPVIEILLANYHGMTHGQVRDELVTIMIGGQETTAFANACAIFLLAHHQTVQEKVFEELEMIFSTGHKNRQPTYEDLQRMEYLERVIKETLRLYPSLPVIGRRLEEDMKIGKYLCPAGSTLIILLKFLHSSPRFYNDPKRFNPDNFLPETCQSRHPYAYIPFSAGYRNCIGMKYGMLQMKTVISTLVRKNQFFPSDTCPTPERLRLTFLTTMKFVNGCYVNVVPRTLSNSPDV